MNTTAPLTGSHLRTHQRIFQHPVSHNLEWDDVYAMFRQLGEVETQPNGNLKITRHGQVLVLSPSRTKDVSGPDEVLALRHFLERTEPAPPAADGTGAHWLLLIDHHEARLFRTEMSGAVPQQILPHAPDEFFRHAHHSRDFSRGQEKPDPNSFFEPVARVLGGAGQLLIFGTGTGTSSEMDQFVAWLKNHYADLAKRIVGAVVVDRHHLTEGELLAKAREFYAGVGKSVR